MVLESRALHQSSAFLVPHLTGGRAGLPPCSHHLFSGLLEILKDPHTKAAGNSAADVEHRPFDSARISFLRVSD